MLMDPAGGGKLVAIDTAPYAADSVVYTVPEGKTFVGFLSSNQSYSGSQSLYKLNGVAQVIPSAQSTSASYASQNVVWPAGTVVAKNAAINFFIQGNER